MSTERTHFVYEAYDADGLLLYVGCTSNPAKRYRAHMTGDPDHRGWFDPFVTDWRLSGPYEKATALRIERERIAECDPIWNGQAAGNRHGRQLIQAYLSYHGVKWEHRPNRGRPYLVPAGRRRPRKQVAA